MVIGIGTDVVQIPRMEHILAHGDAGFIAQVCAPTELQAIPPPSAPIRQQAAWLARRFAAKEALAKALGVGLGGALCMPELALTHDGQGAPQFALAAGAQAEVERLVRAKGGTAPRIWVSVSDDYPVALAVVVEAGRLVTIQHPGVAGETA